MASTEDPPRRGWFRRWWPVLPLVAVTIVSAGVARQVDLDPTPHHRRSIRAAASAPTVPALSIRRTLSTVEPLTSDGALTAALDAFVATQPTDSCLVVTAGPYRYEHRADDPQIPASLQKLRVASAALRTFGADATLDTVLATTAPAVDGRIDGDLYLVGGGDPLLASATYMAHFRNQPQEFRDVVALADAVVAAGITSIGGSVIGDDSRFDEERYSPAWSAGIVAQRQSGPISALTVNDGFSRFPGNGTTGLDPAADPALDAALVLHGLLAERGVAIGGGAARGITPAEAAPLASVPSLPVHALVAEMLRESDNGTAEVLLKELGFRHVGIGSFATGLDALRDDLDATGVLGADAVLADGSGLSLDNRASCAELLDVLATPDTAAAVADGLAVAGQTGTLARRWVDTEVAGRVRAKTGTLNRVSGLAGYAEMADGRDATFAFVANVDDGRVEREAIDAQYLLAEALIRGRATIDLDHLRP